jgi:hypothetical protein
LYDCSCWFIQRGSFGFGQLVIRLSSRVIRDKQYTCFEKRQPIKDHRVLLEEVIILVNEGLDKDMSILWDGEVTFKNLGTKLS